MNSRDDDEIVAVTGQINGLLGELADTIAALNSTILAVRNGQDAKGSPP